LQLRRFGTPTRCVDPVHVPYSQRSGQALAARIFAWVLEQMSSEYPMMGPAEITRDPRCAIPLAGHG
jgi:hypothetical protein